MGTRRVLLFFSYNRGHAMARPRPKRLRSLFASSRATAFETDNGRSVFAAGTAPHAPKPVMAIAYR
jgi:hypothetical protein